MREASIVFPSPTSSASSTREQVAGDLGGDAELVGDQVDAPTHESADARFAASMLVTEGGDAEVEVGGGIDVGRHEALLGSVEGEGV